MLTIEKERQLIILLSLWDLGGTATKSETLDNILNKGYIELSGSDKDLRSNGEEAWRNNLAYVRSHLKGAGYIDGSQRDQWNITISGISYLKTLSLQAVTQKQWRTITSNAISRAHSEIIGSPVTPQKTAIAKNTSAGSVANNTSQESNISIKEIPEQYILKSMNELEKIIAVEEQKCNTNQTFEPSNIQDARERTIGSIVRRRGQSSFRRQLLTLYQGKCAITGTDAEQALEAAHIIPYKGGNTNHPANGLLLRADIHTLFELRLITIDSQTMTVLVSPELATTSYAGLAGVLLQLPVNRADWPSVEALNKHRSEAGL